MAADELVVVVEGHYFFGDAVEQLLMIAAGQIRAADRALKQNITHQDHFLGVVDEYDMSRGMAGAVADFKFMFADGDYVPFIQPAVWRSIGKPRQPV